jgi:hypothetical protein
MRIARVAAVDQQATSDLNWRKASERSCECGKPEVIQLDEKSAMVRLTPISHVVGFETALL